MKTTYIQPEVQVMDIQCVTVIAASAPAGINMGINTGVTTDDQW